MNNKAASFNKFFTLLSLLFPLTLMRFMFWISAICGVLHIVLRPLVGWEWLIFPTLIAVGANFILWLVLVPNWVSALTSSRPVSLLGNMRAWLLAVMIITAFLLTLVLQLCLLEAKVFQEWSTFLTLIFLLSVLIPLSVWVCSRWPNMHRLMYLPTFLFPGIFQYLEQFHPLFLLGVSIVLWMIFSHWFLNHRPEKFQPDFDFLTTSSFSNPKTHQLFSSFFMSEQAQTWVGSRLISAPDDWKAQIKKSIAATLITTIFFSPYIIFLTYQELSGWVFQGAISFAAYGVVLSGITTVDSFRKNLKSVWLCFDGNREDLHSFLWRKYWASLASTNLFYLFAGVVLESIFVPSNERGNWVLLLLTALISNTLNYYVIWYSMQQKSGWLSPIWTCVCLSVVWSVSLFATSLFLPPPFEWQGISIWWIWLPALAVIALLHKKVRRNFATMNLARAN